MITQQMILRVIPNLREEREIKRAKRLQILKSVKMAHDEQSF